MPRSIIFLLSLTLLLLLAACSPAGNTPAAETPTSGLGSEDPGYPGPETPYEPPYPIEGFSKEAFEAGITPNAPPPTFSAETGALTIQLRYPDGERPVRGQLFFVAGTIPVQGVEDAFIPALDAANDPSGQSDSLGVLVISDIPPGRYALALSTPLGAILVEEAGSNEPVVFEITANEVTDLGSLSVFLNAEKLEP